MDDAAMKEALLAWLGVDSFVLRLLRMAHELHNSEDEAHEVFCRLREEGYFRLKTAADMPKGAAARFYRKVSAEELLLERVRLAPKLMLFDSRLAEFVLRDCLATLRLYQPSSEVFHDTAEEDSICRLYKVLACAIRDCAGKDGELVDQLRLACSELCETSNREACLAAIDEVLA